MSTRRLRFADQRSSVSIVLRAKISDAMFGEVFKCDVQTLTDVNDLGGGGDNTDTIPRPARCAVKSLNLNRAKTLARATKDRTVDDPLQEQHVATALIATGGHPNVVQPLCHFREDDMLFLVSELCEDGDLHSYLSAECADNTVSENESLHVMRQILLGVQFLHRLGVAHRDLSLENILLSDGVCKVSDFGLSIDAHQECSGWVGKEYYMAPEVVAREGTYDPVKADVWSLGVIWFVLLTGSPLVAIASPNEKLLDAIAQSGVGVVFRAWGIEERVSPEVTALLSRMLQVDPSVRASVADILAHPLMQTIRSRT